MNNKASSHTAITDAGGSLQTASATCEFLQQYSPYSEIAEEVLLGALQHARLGYYAAGDSVIAPEDGIPDHFSIVQQGLVTGRRETNGSSIEVFASGPGESFLNVALLEQRPTSTQHIAEHDSFIIEIPRQGFDYLLHESPAFRDFCQRRASTLVDMARQRMRAEATSSMQTERSLDTPLAKLIHKQPVSCPPQTSIAQAVQQMHAQEVSSILVLDEHGQAAGIFTLRDLRRLIASGEFDLNKAIATAMTPSPLTLSADLPAYEATLSMLQQKIGHIILTSDDNVVGVISERDLFALKKINLVQISRQIEQADSIAELSKIREPIKQVIQTMLAEGASAHQLTGIITGLNDAMVKRVISISREQWHEPVPDFTWLSFGSEARGEQTLATDQDNGILFEDGDNPTIRETLLPLARHINQGLDQVGFTLCRGNIMAGNPELCLSRSEWQAKYRDIIASASPQKLLYATIFLDFRSLYGATDAVDALRHEVLGLAQGNTIFLHALAQDSLAHKPPLGMFRSFVTQRGKEGKVLDLKVSGLQPFISGVRVLALANQVSATNTEERIDELARLEVIQAHNAAAWKEAFSFIQLLRLRVNQAQLKEQRPLNNDIDPYRLNPLDKRILKEALRQGSRLQTRLKLDYS